MPDTFLRTNLLTDLKAPLIIHTFDNQNEIFKCFFFRYRQFLHALKWLECYPDLI